MLIRFLFAAAACAAFVTASIETKAADDFSGQTITFVAGSPPGGGYDSYIRPMIQHMARHVPGNPTMIVQSMPGAGGLRAANYIYNKAPKDGTVMGMVSAATAFEPLFGNAEAIYDTPKFTWLGNMDEIIGTCDVWNTSGIKSFDEMFTKQVTFGAAGVGSASYQLAIALKNLLGLKLNLVKGYGGATEVNLAMQRGEVAGSCGISLFALKTVYSADYNAKRLVPILQVGINKHPDLAGVAHLYDYAKNDEDRGVFDLVFGRYVLGRPIMAPPGVSPEKTKMLRTAFMETMKDPQFLADAEKLHIEIQATDGEEVEKIVKRFFSYPKNVTTRAVKAME
jgi:tripartite-type tricarboxylate transporter receptor subunit TctC